tara:strand:- start:279 stop:569 length:291 start_codon:yes stop_codon:yes gene_type:complete
MRYRLVEVIWIDAEEYGDTGWNDLKAMKQYAKKPCPEMRTVGYVLHQSDTHISLASTVGEKECSSIEKIPCQFVKNIKELDPAPAADSRDQKGKGK